MASNAPPILDDDESLDNPFLQWFLLFGMVIIPFACLILLTFTSLNVTLGRAIGVNLPKSDQLVVYDALCTNTTMNRVLHLTFWSQDSAPVTVVFGKVESPNININAGVTTLDVTIRSQDPCPDAITLIDRSRNRRAGGSVEIITP